MLTCINVICELYTRLSQLYTEYSRLNNYLSYVDGN